MQLSLGGGSSYLGILVRVSQLSPTGEVFMIRAGEKRDLEQESNQEQHYRIGS